MVKLKSSVPSSVPECFDTVEELKINNIQNMAIIQALEAKIDTLESGPPNSTSNDNIDNDIVAADIDECFQGPFAGSRMEVPEMTTTSNELSANEFEVTVSNEALLQNSSMLEVKKTDSEPDQISELEKLNEQNMKLTTDLNELQTKFIFSRQQQSDAMESYMDYYKKEIATGKNRESELKVVVKTQEQQLTQVQAKIEQSEDTHSKLIAEMSVTESNEIALHEQITDLQGVVTRLELRSEVACRLEEENERLNTTLLAVEKELNRYRHDAKQASTMLEKHNEKTSGQVSEMERENEYLSKDLAEKNSKLDHVKGLFREKLEEVVKMSREISSLTDQSKELQLNNDSKDSKIRELSASLVELDAGVSEKLREAIHTKTELVKKLQDTLKQAEETNEDLFTQLEVRDQKIVELADSIRGGLDILKLKEEENTMLLARMKDLDEEVEQIRIELDQKVLALDLANANLARTQSSNTTYSSVDNDVNGDFDEQDEDLDHMRQELDQRTQIIKELMEQLDVKTIDYHNLESKVEDLNGRLLDKNEGRESEIKRQMESLMAQIEIVKQQADTSDKQAKSLEEENTQLKEENIELMEEAQSSINSNKNVEQIQLQLNDLTELVHKKEQELATKNDQMVDYIDEKDAEMTQLSATIKLQEEHICEVGELRVIINKLTVEKENNLATIEQLQQASSSASPYYTGSRGASPPDTLADSLAAMHDENDYFKEEITKKDEEIEELKDQVENVMQTCSKEKSIFETEIQSMTDENLNLREYNEKYVTRICELEDEPIVQVNQDEKLKIQLEMINQMNDEIESLRGKLLHQSSY